MTLLETSGTLSVLIVICCSERKPPIMANSIPRDLESLPQCPQPEPQPFAAFCIECGVQIPPDHFSHLFCKGHYSHAKALHAGQLKAKRCNICGGMMSFFVEPPTNLAHGDCLVIWLRATVEAADRAELKQREERH